MSTATTTRVPAREAKKPDDAVAAAQALKARLLASLTQVRLGIEAASKRGEAGNDVDRVLRCTDAVLASTIALMERHPLTWATSNRWSHALWDVHSLLSASAMLDGDSALRVEAILAQESVVNAVLSELDDTAFPSEDSDAVDARDFMDGMALAVKLLAEARVYEDEGRDDHEASAYYRGRGVAQTVFARPFFETLALDPALLEGFASGMSAALPRAGDMAPGLAELTYEDCLGGPSTKYIQEEEPEAHEPQPLGVVLDQVAVHIAAACEAPLLIPADDEDFLAQASAALAHARASTRAADTEAAMQDARKYVWKQREELEGHPFGGDSSLDGARAQLLAAHRLLNKCLGGTMREERQDLSPTALATLVDRLDSYIEMTEHGPAHEGEDPVFERIHQGGVHSAFYDVAEAEARGHDEGAVLCLATLLANINGALAVCDIVDARWPLLTMSAAVIGEFLSTGAEA